MKRQQGLNIKYTLFCGLSSFLASLASNIIHPLQVIKTRFQSHDGNHNNRNVVPKYESVYSALGTILKNEGFSGLYKGFFVNVLSHSSVQVIFFTIYETRLRYLNENKQNKFMTSVLESSLQASISATLITQPLWVVRTRMLLTTDKIKQKDNFIQNAQQIYKQYGLKGFTRGLGVSLILSLGGFIQMSTFQACKIMFESIKRQQNSNSVTSNILNVRAFLAGGTAKVMNSLLNHPLTTIRTRYQQQQFLSDKNSPKYNGNFDIVKKIIKQQGFRGFYKGFYVNLLKGFIQKGIYFYCYQLFKSIFGVQRKTGFGNQNRVPSH